MNTLRHPLERLSLAPYGFVFPVRRQRLAYVPPNRFGVDEEKLVVRLWERWNRIDRATPPLQTILHRILPAEMQEYPVGNGSFTHGDLLYRTRDVLILSSAVQWLGCNMGRYFLEEDISEKRDYSPEKEFSLKLAAWKKEKGIEPAAFFAHVCNIHCRPSVPWVGCHYRRSDISARDEAVVAALMDWLGSEDGRAFLAAFKAKKKALWERQYRQERRALRCRKTNAPAPP